MGTLYGGKCESENELERICFLLYFQDLLLLLLLILAAKHEQDIKEVRGQNHEEARLVTARNLMACFIHANK